MTDNTYMDNAHKIETTITTVIPATHGVESPAAAQRVYQRAFKAYEAVIESAGGSCDADTTAFNPVLKFPVGSKVFHKNVGRDEGLDYVEIPESFKMTTEAMAHIVRRDGKRMYQPNIAVVTDYAINEDGSIGYETWWWNPQFAETEWFPENELEAV